MAFTPLVFWGFETGGLEEVGSTAGSPTAQTDVVRTGTYAARLESSASLGTGSIGGTDVIGGFALRFTNLTPATAYSFYNFLRLKTDGDVEVLSSGGTVLSTITAPFTANQWHYVEFYTVGGVGTWELWIDGISKASGSANMGTSTSRTITGPGTGDGILYVDDAYFGTITATSERLSNGFTAPFVEVVGPYQKTDGGVIDGGDELEFPGAGTPAWANVSQTPLAEGGNSEAGYTSTSKSGYCTTNSGTRPGPNGDTRFSYGTLVAARWIHRLKRGSGSTTTHWRVYGNSGATPSTLNTTLSTSYFSYSLVATDVMPSKTQTFRQGFGLSGAQDIICAEIWSTLLQQRSGLDFSLHLGRPYGASGQRQWHQLRGVP